MSNGPRETAHMLPDYPRSKAKLWERYKALMVCVAKVLDVEIGES